MRAGAYLALFVPLSACVVVAPHREPSAADRTAGAFAANELRAHVRFLADDALEGRGPGTRGDLLTQLYLGTAFERLGLAPAMPDGSWTQPFDLLGVTSASPPRWTFTAAEKSLSIRSSDDFVAVSQLDEPQVCVAGAEVVFAGYGIQAPEYEWDDFKGADLRGKVLLLLNDDPDWDPQLFAGKRRLYYGRWTYKYESAARQGAAGAIIIHTTESAAYPWQTVQTSWGGENSRLPEMADDVRLRAWVTHDAATRLAALGGENLERLTDAARRRDFRPVPLGVTTSLCVRNQVRRYRTANVLALLPGTDPARRGELVVYSAHHDHLGRKNVKDGDDDIYNGALDNACGIAQMLAIARAFAASSAPRRSVLFLATAAEEQGLLGSEYFAAHPVVAPERIVANLNLDGGNIWGRTGDVSFIGFGKSTLDRFAERAAALQKRRIVEEPDPDRGAFYRSDQFNFARIGVPALFLKPGQEVIGKPDGWGSRQQDDWLAKHYHQPSDEYDASWNFDGMVEDARLAFEIGRMVADTDEAPTWFPGDEFEKLRAPPAGAAR